jgi:hypothetical protein
MSRSRSNIADVNRREAGECAELLGGARIAGPGGDRDGNPVDHPASSGVKRNWASQRTVNATGRL